MAQILFARDSGYIVGVWENGDHLGQKVVSGTWDDPVIAQNLCVLDTSGSRQEAVDIGEDAMTSSISALPCLSPWFEVVTSSLAVSSQDELTNVGRADTSNADLSGCLTWGFGYDEDLLKNELGIT